MFASGLHPEMGKWLSAVRVLKADDGGKEPWGSVSMTTARARDVHKVHDIAQASMDRRREHMPGDDDCTGCMMQEFPDDANLAILQVCPPTTHAVSVATPPPPVCQHGRSDSSQLCMAARYQAQGQRQAACE